jgi:NAD(P)-dependent dehydrogenase (short-subunit alcohol dehydrogenase family)
MTGRVALVTGASRGIGFAIAARLLADGFAVCITARSPDGLAKAAEQLGHADRLMTSSGKSDDPRHRGHTIEAVVERFGRLDVLVNNAGVNPVAGDLMDLDQGAAEKILGVNLLAGLGWVHEARRHGGPDGLSAIVNISSFATIRPSPAIGMYAISKAAVTQMTKQLAFELAPKVRVNAVVPALIDTQFAAALHAGREEEIAATYPLKRVGRPDDVAGAVAFLISADSAWITGETLLVDGGLSLTGGVG